MKKIVTGSLSSPSWAKIGDPGKFVEPAARQDTHAIEMRLQPSKIIWFKIQSEKIAQAAVDGVEILARAIGRDMIGGAADILGFSVVERFVRWNRVHG